MNLTQPNLTFQHDPFVHERHVSTKYIMTYLVNNIYKPYPSSGIEEGIKGICVGVPVCPQVASEIPYYVMRTLVVA